MMFDSGTKIVQPKVYRVEIFNRWNTGWWIGTNWKAGLMSDLSNYEYEIERAEAKETDEADDPSGDETD